MSCDNPREIPHLDSLFPQLVIDLLRHGKGARFRALGRSMYPTIREDDVITVVPIDADSVRRGDIILYRLGCGVVAHRLVRKDHIREGSFRYILCSDTWGAWDEPVLAEQILGKVISVARSGRSIQVYSGKMKMRLLAHVVASRLRRWIN
ncbi:MAG: hypothetical protein L7F78_03625 [Syntrophales bacterium LBB04]|jgi:hypothetical protein|nr:hypothetical protein [Syntrophales bacterium LBB04]